LHARLTPADPSDDARLSGHEVYFVEHHLRPGRQSEKADADERGHALVSWQFPASKFPTGFVVRYRGKGRELAEDTGARVFVRPADTPLLIVDAVHALTSAGEEVWGKKNLLDIEPISGAAPALAEAQKLAYQVVYLCGGAGDARAYRT